VRFQQACVDALSPVTGGQLRENQSHACRLGCGRRVGAAGDAQVVMPGGLTTSRRCPPAALRVTRLTSRRPWGACQAGEAPALVPCHHPSCRARLVAESNGQLIRTRQFAQVPQREMLQE
jgi:hypothetical protein